MIFSKIKDLSGESYERLLTRSADVQSVLPAVAKIIEDVRKRGNKALKHYTWKFDGVKISDFRVSSEEFKNAKKAVGKEVIGALGEAYKNILEFHRQQVPKGWSLIPQVVRKSHGLADAKRHKVWQIVRAINSVGCYIPGGRAAYPSTVLMTAVPAKVAGVARIIVTTPSNKWGNANETVLAACSMLGIREVYKVGGAQAVAAMAFGTETIPKVEKIVGPGSVYVTAAKRLVSDQVAIDMLAGPSEVLIIADASASPELISADMLAQAEHDPNSASVLVTTSREIGKRVLESTRKLGKNSAILIAEDLKEAVEFSNAYAPEHLEIMTKKPRELLKRIENAGSIFLGKYTPVACGDYATGTNHVLPTGGLARACSGLSVRDFVKLISVQELDRKTLEKLGKTTITLAEAEGLHAHAESVRKRFYE